MSERMTSRRPDYIICALLLSVMAVLTFANILCRYLLNYSISFTEELTIHLFVALVVVGSSIAFERGAQLGVQSFYRVFPVRVQKGIQIFGAILSSLLFFIVDVFLIRAIYAEVTLFHAKSPAFGFPIWIYYAVIVVLSVCVFVNIWRGRRK